MTTLRNPRVVTYEHEQREKAAYAAVKAFVEEDKWPKRGTLPVCVRFQKGLKLR